MLRNSPRSPIIAIFVLLIAVIVGFIVSTVVIGVSMGDAQAKTNLLLTRPFVSVEPSCHGNENRRTLAYHVKSENAFVNFARPNPCQENNGDDSLVNNYASFTKGLQHDSLGHVNPSSYAMFLKAVQTNLPSDWDAVPLAVGAVRKLVNPQAGLAFVNEGGDSHAFSMLPAPRFSSAQQAGEMVENYWMALTRDVSFVDYPTNSMTLQAISGLAALSDFRGPSVSAATLFRGLSSGCLVGPYISQFMYMPCPFGANFVERRLLSYTAGVDYMTTVPTYLAQQNVQPVEAPATFEPTLRYIINGRDLGRWVHMDVLFQAYFEAMLCLLDMGAPLKPGIPYTTSSLNQIGFGTFGGPHIAQMSTISATAALKAVWYQKWQVHRKLRPEVMGMRVHSHKTAAYSYPIHADLLNSNVLDIVFAQYGTYLLPQAFPEGSPVHGSYGAGHATVAGAAVTVLKAMFDEDYVFPSPVMPNADGTVLLPLSPHVNLTVGGELDKLANNVAIGRNIAGVHWRSDATESLKLGEQVAISILRDMRNTFSEPFQGWSFRSFDGTLITV